MSNLETSSFDLIVRKVHDLYDSLGKSGKPKQDEEWTCLAAFVKEWNSAFSVVSLATGTKCIGGNAMVKDGTVVNDSHAEVLARRNFLRYLYDQIEEAVQNNPSIFIKNDKKFIMKPGVQFHFFSSQVPCGDASIIPMDTAVDCDRVQTEWDKNCVDFRSKPASFQTHLQFRMDNLKDTSGVDNLSVNSACLCPLGNKRKHTEDESFTGKKIKMDVYRTGAKPVKTDHRQDPKGDGLDYHARGAIRIKPGRGDPTKSLSCSDKIAKWLYCGIEGALLSTLLQDRISLSSIIIGGAGPFDRTILEEAIVGRSGLKKSPVFWRSAEIFKHSSYATNASRPCAASINWADVNEKKLEISVEGRRLGVTKKSKAASYLFTSKLGLFKKFLQLTDDPHIKGLTYRAAKETAIEYQARKIQFIQAMRSWSEDKSSFEQFSINFDLS